MLRLYDCLESGNGYKVRLLLNQLGQPFERVELNVYNGETRSAEYQTINPNFRIPMLEWPDGRRLAESNAILHYLAEGSALSPNDRWQRAQILQWQNFEQYSHEPFIAVLRYWQHADSLDENAAQVATKFEGGLHALSVMEQHLATNRFFVADQYTIADISLYAYTHVAHEAGFDLSPYSGINNWLNRIQAQDGHVTITQDVGDSIEWSAVCDETRTEHHSPD